MNAEVGYHRRDEAEPERFYGWKKAAAVVDRAREYARIDIDMEDMREDDAAGRGIV